MAKMKPVTRILINGIEGRHIDALDRGLQYGDGLFETLRIRDGRPRHWDEHMQRLAEGCARLRLPAVETEPLAAEARLLSQGVADGVLKIVLTRGDSGRGYAPPVVVRPTRLLALFPPPSYPPAVAREGVAVRVCDTRLGHSPALAGIKHLNRLEQVLARAEWKDRGTAEGLMLDNEGNVIEGTMSNLFLLRDGRLSTPELSRCGVAGVTRARVMRLAPSLGMAVEQRRIAIDDLAAADELFLTNSVIGLWPVRHCAGRDYTPGPLTARLAEALEADDG